MVINGVNSEQYLEEDQTFVETVQKSIQITLENSFIKKNLENLIKKRTLELEEKSNDILSMLQNMQQGIYCIMPSMTIHPEYSPVLEEILNEKADIRRSR